MKKNKALSLAIIIALITTTILPGCGKKNDAVAIESGNTVAESTVVENAADDIEVEEVNELEADSSEVSADSKKEVAISDQQSADSGKTANSEQETADSKNADTSASSSELTADGSNNSNKASANSDKQSANSKNAGSSANSSNNSNQQSTPANSSSANSSGAGGSSNSSNISDQQSANSGQQNNSDASGSGASSSPAPAPQPKPAPEPTPAPQPVAENKQCSSSPTGKHIYGDVEYAETVGSGTIAGGCTWSSLQYYVVCQYCGAHYNVGSPVRVESHNPQIEVLEDTPASCGVEGRYVWRSKCDCGAEVYDTQTEIRPARGHWYNWVCDGSRETESGDFEAHWVNQCEYCGAIEPGTDYWKLD